MAEVSVKAPKVGREVTVEADIPESLDALVAKYGEEAVTTAAIGNFRIALQGFLRQMLEGGASDEKVAEAAISWVPGAKRDTTAALISKVGKMSADEKAALMKALGL